MKRHLVGQSIPAEPIRATTVGRVRLGEPVATVERSVLAEPLRAEPVHLWNSPVMFPETLRIKQCEPPHKTSANGSMQIGPRPLSSKFKMKFEGPKSGFRVTNANATPVFEATRPGDLRASKKILLIEPRVEKDEREFEAARYDIAGSRKAKIKTVPLDIQQTLRRNVIAGTSITYQVKPAQPLNPGEYVLSIQEGMHYDSGVERGEEKE